MRGHECYYVCADDAHGTPIMLRARAEGIEAGGADRPGLDRAHRGLRRLRASASTTITRPTPKKTASARRPSTSATATPGTSCAAPSRRPTTPRPRCFCPIASSRATCPKCGAEDQYGDSCEVCGSTYSPTELKNPVSAVSGATPIEKDSEHLFFKLGNFETDPERLAQGRACPDRGRQQAQRVVRGRPERLGHLARRALFRLRDPGRRGQVSSTSGWTRPIGYMASFRNFCDRTGVDFDAFWNADSNAELYHFIGKDIIYFHALFWPAMLHGAGFRKPTGVYAHGFLTVDGAKMSKSRGTFIKAQHLPQAPESRVPALLLCRQAQFAGRRHRPQPRGLCRARQCRPGRQGGQYRQPMRRLHQASASTADCRDSLDQPELFEHLRQGGRRDRRPVRKTRIRTCRARDHGAGRSCQSVHRRKGPLGGGQAGRPGRTAARHLLDGDQSVPGADRLSETDPAGDGRAGRGLPQRRRR